MLSRKMDFNCCANRDGFHIDSHICILVHKRMEYYFSTTAHYAPPLQQATVNIYLDAYMHTMHTMHIGIQYTFTEDNYVLAMQS